MLNKLRSTCIILCTLLSASVAICQSGDNSPFSRFGLGDLSNENLIHLRSMGDLSAAYTDIYHTNVKNPASFAFQKTVTYDLGISSKYASLSDNENSSGKWSGSLDYLSFTLPLFNPYNELLDVKKRDFFIATNFTVSKYSDVSYNITSRDDLENIGSVTNNFNGTGGTFKAQWGNSFKYKEIAFGLNMGYAFGKISNNKNTSFNNIDLSFDNRFSNSYTMRGFVYNLGAIYQLALNEDVVKANSSVPLKLLNIGLYGNSATSFSTVGNIINGSIASANLQQFVQDTALVMSDIQGNGTLPSEFGIGAVYSNGDNLTLGVNYSLNKWSKYKNDARPEELSDTYKITFGGYYRPNYRSFSYTDRIYYRFGVFYGTDPRMINANALNNYGLNLGFGLPFVSQRKISHLNLGMTIGSRGNGNVLKENYIQFGVGFTFNDDEWFVKRKYN